MNPNSFNNPDRYLWNFGRYYGIAELKESKEVRKEIKIKFLENLKFSIPESEKVQTEIINLNFEKFKFFVSKIYQYPAIKFCNKKLFNLKDAKKTLKYCSKIGRYEKTRYYCETCFAWHLTSQPKRF